MECTWFIPTIANKRLITITEFADIFTRNDNMKAKVYGDAIPGGIC